MMQPQRILNVGIQGEQDIVTVRQRARQISGMLGFGPLDQVRIATAVSEVARSAVYNPAGGRAAFCCDANANQPILSVKISGIGMQPPAVAPGIAPEPQLDDAIVAAHRLMDKCTIDSGTGGMMITLTKRLPKSFSMLQNQVNEIGARFTSMPVSTLEEVHQQNQELLSTLAELRSREEDLVALTRELEDTNRGVMALYAEIEEKAERLQRADEMKSRFLSNTSHELRTPLSSIRALTKLLLDRMDGELSEEQERQVSFIDKAAGDLSELVNDLLDLAKIEAGKVTVNCDPISVPHLFSALKGMMRPLAVRPEVELVFEDFAAPEEFRSDENKVAQILRNFISNALKFTERGEVRVSAALLPDGGIRFSVRDTGIGIATDDIALVFEEFGQIESHLQRTVKGTGLGLPLCRKLATLLQGAVSVESAPGTGSCFMLDLPLRIEASPAPAPQ